jgi:hypothetical protein
VPGLGDGGVHEDRGAAELEGDRGVAGGADPGVDDDGDLGLLDDEAEVVRVADAEAAADRGGERHDGGAAHVLELAADDRVVGAVREDGEALVEEGAGGLEGLLVVGEQGARVADDLELDELGDAELAREAEGADGLVGGVAAGGVGQQAVAVAVDPAEEVVLGLEVDAAQGHGHDLGAAGGEGGLGLGGVLELAGADDEARGPGAAREGPGVLRSLTVSLHRQR